MASKWAVFVFVIAVLLGAIASPAVAAERVTRTVKSTVVTVKTPTFAADASVFVEARQHGRAMPEVGGAGASAFWANRCVIVRATSVLDRAAPVTFKIVNVCRKPQRVTVLWRLTTEGAALASYDGERVTRDPLVLSAVASAGAYWRARGVYPCETPTVYVVPDRQMEGSVEEADFGGCGVWLGRDLVREAHRDWTGASRETLWVVLAHALGHTAAVTFPDRDGDGEREAHSATGLMGGGGGLLSCREARVWRRAFDRRFAPWAAARAN